MCIIETVNITSLNMWYSGSHTNWDAWMGQTNHGLLRCMNVWYSGSHAHFEALMDYCFTWALGDVIPENYESDLLKFNIWCVGWILILSHRTFLNVGLCYLFILVEVMFNNNNITSIPSS